MVSGTDNGATVFSGGEIMIYAGATVSDLTVSSGGVEVFVSSRGSSVAMAATTAGAVTASPTSATVESTVANLMQVLAGLTAREGAGALF